MVFRSYSGGILRREEMKINIFKRKTKSIPTKPLPELNSIQDVLARDDLNEFLSDMDKEKANIAEDIIIYTTKDGKEGWEMTENITLNAAIGMLERTKLTAIQEFSKENEE
jgi:hypothetical protein